MMDIRVDPFEPDNPFCRVSENDLGKPGHLIRSEEMSAQRLPACRLGGRHDRLRRLRHLRQPPLPARRVPELLGDHFGLLMYDTEIADLVGWMHGQLILR
jgi:hypothetical protein